MSHRRSPMTGQGAFHRLLASSNGIKEVFKMDDGSLLPFLLPSLHPFCHPGGPAGSDFRFLDLGVLVISLFESSGPAFHNPAVVFMNILRVKGKVVPA